MLITNLSKFSFYAPLLKWGCLSKGTKPTPNLRYEQKIDMGEGKRHVFGKKNNFIYNNKIYL